jgi:hypothetical protein
VKYKKEKFLTVNSSTQVRHFIGLLSENLSFLYFLKYKVFLNGTFLCTLLVSKSIYIFNHIIFEDTKVWDFEKFQKTKSDGSTGAHVHKTFSYPNIGSKSNATHSNQSMRFQVLTSFPLSQTYIVDGLCLLKISFSKKLILQNGDKIIVVYKNMKAYSCVTKDR